MIVRDIWHKYDLWYFRIVSNFTHLTAREITYNNFEISLVVFMPNITANHAITYTNNIRPSKLSICQLSQTQHLNLVVSHTGHQISQIKLTFMIESVFLVGNYVHPSPLPPNLTPPWLMEHFCTFFITDKDNFLSFQSQKWTLMICNLCKTS